MRILGSMLVPLLAFAAGCASYSWRPAVPEGMRTVSVPTFRNESDVTELGDVVARQVLREIQREGTFTVARSDDAALEVQGIVKEASSSVVAYERRTGARNRERRFAMTASVSVVDRRGGKVLVDGRKYKASTSFLVNDDVVTGERDASGRLAEDIARQIVDDLLALKW